jgi:hypothetical protein
VWFLNPVIVFFFFLPHQQKGVNKKKKFTRGYSQKIIIAGDNAKFAYFTG